MKVFLDSVGCRLNQSELELLAQDLQAAGAEVVGKAESCEAAILNTCAVTRAAAADSRGLARRVRRRNPSAPVILTGCWATLEPAAAKAVIGNARTVPNAQKGSIVRMVVDGASPAALAPTEQPAIGGRPRQRAFLKIQEGCDHACTFCVTTVARGPSRSLPPEAVLRQVEHAQRRGAREFVLCGVQLGAYGRDLPERPNLAWLARRILRAAPEARLRLSSLEPWDVTEELLALWSDRRMCPSLHLPLQSGSPSVLRRMKRPISADRYLRIREAALRAVPSLALTTDLLVGFPGESLAEFEQSCAFVRELRLAGAHVFAFSPRPGTDAEGMPGRVSAEETKRRSRAMRQLAAAARRRFLQDRVGTLEQALWLGSPPESAGLARRTGITGCGIPITAQVPGSARGSLNRVLLDGLDGEGWAGTVLA